MQGAIWAPNADRSAVRDSRSAVLTTLVLYTMNGMMFPAISRLVSSASPAKMPWKRVE